MSTSKNKKAIVALSGGVDSSVAAVLLKEQGYLVEGVFMRLGNATDDESEKNARAVAKKIGIKFHAINLSKEFKEKIIDYFISEYQRGRTPNPCVECNKEIKFGLLMDKVLEMGADYIATGHYARLRNVIARESQSRDFMLSLRGVPQDDEAIPKLCTQNLVTGLLRHSVSLSLNSIPRNDNTKAKLLKAKDENKDQSYFLYNLNQKILKRCLFPLGDYTKDEVRKIASKNEILKDKFHNQKESQEICFIQSKYYGNFLRKYLKLIPGNITNKKGDVLGRHKGLPLYTIGQRRDIGIGGTGPYFVIGMNRGKNQLIVSDNKNDKNLFSKELIAKKVNWISGQAPNLPIKIKAKVRYRMDEELADVDKIKGKYVIKFSKPQRAVMPGQSIVFYKGDETLGGGIIA